MHFLIIFSFSYFAYPHSAPIALMKTKSEVEPAEMNGSGSPVGGIEPLNTSYCIIIFNIISTLLLAIRNNTSL